MEGSCLEKRRPEASERQGWGLGVVQMLANPVWQRLPGRAQLEACPLGHLKSTFFMSVCQPYFRKDVSKKKNM